MTRNKEPEATYIDTARELQAFANDHAQNGWMCFDTEFVGEKRFATRICLIQAATARGHFLIDPICIDDLSPFVDLLTDPSIVKITHAGENDYRLFYEGFGIAPRNIFDTQIAAGFAGYRYPISLQALVRSELGLRMKKGYTVADWESRPISQRQLSYALDDIRPLPELWKALDHKLRKTRRSQWALKEFRVLERPEYYAKDPHEEVLNSRLIQSLNKKDQAFLLRLYDWRRSLAREKDYSKNMILPKKVITQIVRTIPAGAQALKDNRRVPTKIASRHGDTFERMYKAEITDEERKLLQRVPSQEKEDPEETIIMEMLYLVVKYKCLRHGISENLVLPRGILKELRRDPSQADALLVDSWRSEFLGPTLVHWLRHFDRLNLDVEGEEIRLYLEESLP